MNQGTITQFRRRREPVIRWRGKRLPIAAACELAIREHQLGNFQGVVDLYHLVLATNPRFAEGHNNRGAALHQLKRYDAALASYDQALALKPDYANAHANRAATLRKLSRPDEALASYNRAIALNPNHAEAYNNRGVLLQEMRRHDDARASYERAIALNPDHAVAHNNLGTVLVSKGDMAGAEKMYLKAIQLKPDFPDPLFNLANRIIEVFNQDFLAAPFPSASASRSPVFVVGMPRSGTTLLANMLSNHPAIGMAGELSTIADFTSHLPELTGSQTPYPAAARQMTAAVAAGLITGYEKQLRLHIGPDKPHVIDKNPLNFRHLGFIARLYPQARIIHCTRDRLDICLSNYFQRFPLQMDYSFDLWNIAHFHGEYSRLMAHWKTMRSLNLLEVSYEDMVLRTEKAARAMLDFLGLPWDDRCLSPHTNPCIVETASQWQVRQPIYRRALGRWRHYEKYLSALAPGHS